MHILGLSCFYHDAAAAFVKDGFIIAAAEEERFTRKKHDHSFPKNAIDFCLKEARIDASQIDYVVFHEKPFIKFERIIQTYLATWPLSIHTFLKTIPLWLNQKLWLSEIIKKQLNYRGEVLFSEHHLSHAASCYLLSPFEEAAILTVDGVGEWCTTTKGFGRGAEIIRTGEIHFPHSLGLLYSAFTAFLGFEVNEGEYKVMGMAAYGKPKYADKVRKLIDVKPDGSYHLDMSYFAYHRSFQSFSRKFIKEFGAPRVPESFFSLDDEKSLYYADLAASIQLVLEEVLLKIANRLYEETKCENLCMSGGVALNCSANSRILRETPFKNIFIQPASSDAGAAIGAAAYVYNCVLKFNERKSAEALSLSKGEGGLKQTPRCSFLSPYLGPSFAEHEIKKFLENKKISYEKLDDAVLFKKIAHHLAEDKIIGWYQGRMEIGPRALGNRSIIANPKNPKMKDIVNEKIKHREKFRPFAPSVLHNYTKDYFDFEGEGPYMLFVADVLEHKQAEIPAVTHVNGTARLQTVRRDHNPRYHDLIVEFHKLTGTPVILNTSFNVRGEPIVCTPEEAYNCFMNTDIDILVMENFIVYKDRRSE